MLGIQYPVIIKDETGIEIQIEFLSNVQQELLARCNIVKTDVTFEFQRDTSTYFSSIAYYRLDTQTIEEIVLYDKTTGFARLHFNGYTLTCFGDKNNNTCNPLTEGLSVPVVILSLHFKPPQSWQKMDSDTNQYSIKGSHYSTSCHGTLKC